MNSPLTTFRTESGEELVIITRAEYDRLQQLVEDIDEDEGTARVVRETSAAIARGEDIALPDDVWDAIESGEHPVAAIRKWRQITQQELARGSGLSQGYISQVELRAKQAPVDTLKAIAKVLRVPVSVLLDADAD